MSSKQKQMVSQKTFQHGQKSRSLWLLASAVTVQGFLPATSQTNSPFREVTANDTGRAAHLRYWGEGRGQEQSRIQSRSSKGDLGSKRLHITIQARNTWGTINSNKGNYRASEHAVRPSRGGAARECWSHEEAGNVGKDWVLGFPLKRNTGRREKFCFGVSWAQAPDDLGHGTASQVHSLLGYPHPSPLQCVRERTKTPDSCLQQDGVKNPGPLSHHSKGNTGTSFSPHYLYISTSELAVRPQNRSGRMQKDCDTKVHKKSILPTNSPVPQKEGLPVSSKRIWPSLHPFPCLWPPNPQLRKPWTYGH